MTQDKLPIPSKDVPSIKVSEAEILALVGFVLGLMVGALIGVSK